MRKKKIIISIVVVLCVLVSIFFIMRFDVIGKIRNAINKLMVENKAESEKESPEELKYVTEHDKDGNEYVIEYRKQIVTDSGSGKEVEMWEDTADPKRIYNNYYKGKIEKIEDNKIYFMVDKESKDGDIFCKDVEVYEVVFDIDTYVFEKDAQSHYWEDFINVQPKNPLESGEDFYSVEDLEFLVGKYLRVQECMLEDPYTGDRNKTLIFYLQ